MPPVSSPGLHDQAGSARNADTRAAHVRFRRALMFMVMTLVVPGSAQLAAGDRRVGKIALRVWLALIVVGLINLLAGAVWHEYLFWMVADTVLLNLIRFGLIALAIGWAYLFVDAWRLGKPLSLSLPHRRAVVGINGILCFSVAGTLLFGAHLVAVQRDLILTMFSGDEVSNAQDGRFNVLLLGGDSGAGRWGLRPDSMTIASINAETGKTVLIGLPRNLANFPFRKGSVMAKQFPNGFDCDGCYLNGVSTWAEDHAALFKHSDNPGVDATIMGIEGITGLKINYWAMVNLEGFKGLVDAVGGVTLNVRDRIPVGGLGSDVTGYIEPGVRKLDGHDTLWFARAREGSDDYSRMARQKCVMSAMLSQVSPQVALRNFESIAAASTAMVSTNIPAGEVDRFIALALKAKSQKIATLSLVPPLVVTAHPDISLIKAKIAESFARSEGRAPVPQPPASNAPGDGQRTKPKPSKPPVVTGGSVGNLSDGYAANQADDLGAVC